MHSYLLRCYFWWEIYAEKLTHKHALCVLVFLLMVGVSWAIGNLVESPQIQKEALSPAKPEIGRANEGGIALRQMPGRNLNEKEKNKRERKRRRQINMSPSKPNFYNSSLPQNQPTNKHAKEQQRNHWVMRGRFQVIVDWHWCVPDMEHNKHSINTRPGRSYQFFPSLPSSPSTQKQTRCIGFFQLQSLLALAASFLPLCHLHKSYANANKYSLKQTPHGCVNTFLAWFLFMWQQILPISTDVVTKTNIVSRMVKRCLDQTVGRVGLQ